MKSNNGKMNEDVKCRLERGIARAVRDSLKECGLYEGWRDAAIGGIMGLSVLGGAQSCTNMNYNEPVGQTYASTQTASDWKYNVFIGNEYEASVCDIHRGQYIYDLQINARYYTSENEACNRGEAIWPSWNIRKYNDNGTVDPEYGVTFVKSYMSNGYFVEMYHTSMHTYDGGDMTCYIEVYYINDERLDPEDAIDYIEVYHQKNDRNTTSFIICLNDLKSDYDSPYFNVQ